MNKFVYILRILFQAVMLVGIYLVSSLNADGSFTPKVGFLFGWLLLSFASQFYLMKFVGLYPVSEAVARQKGEHLGEFNLFVAIGLFLAYDFLGPLVVVAFYFWEKRLKAEQAHI
ncbi:hypothetical protein YK48G_11870 [Lentilactobacillus fungorum]|jgi:hypothetical protein|uniref:Uncharacterized protein n=1 Tax=Lentilactobacillus fungorum TaxID=2201250 RepID=A0ABQ3VXX8_9LACO|nr:hypothetical protein [Lentilactobacillus fungorum]GHP13762.1 hypothetical protein YK48G_11870 [Lentilactobacillus fungorum]